MTRAPTKKVIVIGAGLGGMSAAIALAMQGFAVEVFEKNERAGGKLNLLEKDGFKFDLGPSIFTLPQMFRPLFASGGKTLDDYVKLVRVDPQWRNFFEDGEVVDLFEDRARMRKELERFGPDAFGQYEDFLSYSKSQYDAVAAGYFEQGLDTFLDFAKFYGLFGASKMDYLGTMAGGIAKRVEHPKLRAILEYFIKYVGASAYDSPGFMNLMPNIQLEFGLWYVQGGLYELARAFQTRMDELSIRVRYATEVVGLEKQGRIITGVRTQEGPNVVTHPADYVVSNMEVIPAYDKLLHENPRFMKKLAKYEPACSGIVLHLGLNKIYPQLAHHNFFYSHDQKSHFDRVFRKKRLPDDPTIYLVAPTRSDPSQAPEGCDNIKILPHIPSLNDEHPYTREDCLALKERVLDKLERMGLRDLRKHIVVEDFWTPFDIEKKYYSNRGSIYGVLSDRWKNLAFKAPKQSAKYSNLFFAGGSVNPGGGMPMVVLSGRHVARLIAERETRA